MKKLIPFLALTVLATGAYAQGVITFANNVITTSTPYVLDTAGARLTGTRKQRAKKSRAISGDVASTQSGVSKRRMLRTLQTGFLARA